MIIKHRLAEVKWDRRGLAWGFIPWPEQQASDTDTMQFKANHRVYQNRTFEDMRYIA